MTKPPRNRPRYQRATLSVGLGHKAGLTATVKVTNGGLLSIATLVSSILLSTALLVHVAVSEGAQAREGDA